MTYGNKCYFVYKGAGWTRTWSKAKQYCNSLGNQGIGKTILASAPNYGINDFLARLANQRVWLGGERRNWRWSWIDGSPWRYQNWAPGEPNNHQGNEHGLVLNWDWPLGKWNDANKGGWHFAFICQYQYRY